MARAHRAPLCHDRRPMRSIALLALPLCAALAGCRTPRGTVEQPYVTALRLEGVKAFDPDDVAAGLATQGPDRVPVVKVARRWYQLDPDALLVDRKRVEAYYRERGYYRAAVDRAEVVPEGEGRARVVLHVTEGPPVRVARVTVAGLEEAPEAVKAAGKLPIAVGRVFTEAAYDAARDRLLDALHESGWPLAEVTQHAQVLPEEGTAEVTYQVTTGRRYRFGRIFVAGSGAVPRAKVIEQAALEAPPGEWFDDAKLAKVQARVFEMGVFAGVRVARGAPDAERGTVPVVVTVREAPFRTLRVGPGLGFQQSRWEVDASTSWTHRNWLGDLRRMQLDAKGGWAWIPADGGFGRNGAVGLLAAELSQPGAISQRVDLTAKVELERGFERDYAFWSERFRLGTPVRVVPRLAFAPSWNLEVYQLTDLAVSAVPLAGGPTLPQFRSCPNQVCLLSYLEQRATLDLRDDPIATRRGLYLSVSVQEGFRLGGFGYQFLRFLPEARAYWPLGRGTVVALRARAGAVVPLAEKEAPPVVALLSSGGATNMRGYGWERLSPMVLQDGRWVATGGNGLLDGAVELRQHLLGGLGGVLFLDGGNVTEASPAPAEWRNVLKLNDVQLAGGLGLRYATPFGPLRLDVAMRLPTDWSAGTLFAHRFPPVPGSSGHREPIWAVHVSLGEAF